jgi:hypothetical protein
MPRTIDAMFALARRGLTMLRVKRTVEALVADGRVFVDLPAVESVAALTGELARAEIAAAAVAPAQPVDMRALRERRKRRGDGTLIGAFGM